VAKHVSSVARQGLNATRTKKADGLCFFNPGEVGIALLSLCPFFLICHPKRVTSFLIILRIAIHQKASPN
jgi:hypothetical protein